MCFSGYACVNDLVQQLGCLSAKNVPSWQKHMLTRFLFLEDVMMNQNQNNVIREQGAIWSLITNSLRLMVCVCRETTHNTHNTTVMYWLDIICAHMYGILYIKNHLLCFYRLSKVVGNRKFTLMAADSMFFLFVIFASTQNNWKRQHYSQFHTFLLHFLMFSKWNSFWSNLTLL